MNRTSAALLLSLALGMSSCGRTTYSADVLDGGTWAVNFEGATLSIEANGESETQAVDVTFIASVEDSAFDLAETTGYCSPDSEITSALSYPMLCNYQGPGVLLSYLGDDLYPGHPRGTLMGPGSALEAWAQYNQYLLEETSFDVPDPTPSPEPSPSPTPDISPTPAPLARVGAAELKDLTCARAVYHWSYLQLVSRTEAELLLRVTDLVSCVDVEGNSVPEASTSTYFEGKGTLSRIAD